MFLFFKIAFVAFVRMQIIPGVSVTCECCAFLTVGAAAAAAAAVAAGWCFYEGLPSVMWQIYTSN